jgi:hypothetical protein
MKLKTKLFIVISSCMVLLAQSVILGEYIKDKNNYRYCLIVDKTDYIELSKHKSHLSSDPKRVFTCKWTDNNQLGEINVEINTYNAFNTGNKVLFQEPRINGLKYTNSVFYEICMLLSLIGLSFEMVGILALIGYFIYWCFD